MITAHLALALCLLLAQQDAQSVPDADAERSWSKVMYLGGAAGVRGKSMVWQNKLTVSERVIRLSHKGRVLFEIPPASANAITYRSHRHANAQALGVAVAAVGLAGLMALAAKSTDHDVLLEYAFTDGTPSGVLLRLHKDNYGEILAALHRVTRIPRSS
jgi:hypothetical protein